MGISKRNNCVRISPLVLLLERDRLCGWECRMREGIPKFGGPEKEIEKRNTISSNRNLIRMTGCLCARRAGKGYRRGNYRDELRIKN